MGLRVGDQGDERASAETSVRARRCSRKKDRQRSRERKREEVGAWRWRAHTRDDQSDTPLSQSSTRTNPNQPSTDDSRNNPILKSALGCRDSENPGGDKCVCACVCKCAVQNDRHLCTNLSWDRRDILEVKTKVPQKDEFREERSG